MDSDSLPDLSHVEEERNLNNIFKGSGAVVGIKTLKSSTRESFFFPQLFKQNCTNYLFICVEASSALECYACWKCLMLFLLFLLSFDDFHELFPWRHDGNGHNRYT